MLLELLQIFQRDAGRWRLEGWASRLGGVARHAVGRQQLVNIRIRYAGYWGAVCIAGGGRLRSAGRHCPDQGQRGQRADNQNRRLVDLLVTQVEEVPRIGSNSANRCQYCPAILMAVEHRIVIADHDEDNRQREVVVVA